MLAGYDSDLNTAAAGNRALLDSPPAVPTQVPMRLIGLAVILPLSLTLAPLAAEAQPAGKVHPNSLSLHNVVPGLANDRSLPPRAPRARLCRGPEYHHRVAMGGGGRTEVFPAFASAVVRLNVDVIVAANDAAGRAAQQATKRNSYRHSCYRRPCRFRIRSRPSPDPEATSPVSACNLLSWPPNDCSSSRRPSRTCPEWRSSPIPTI